AELREGTFFAINITPGQHTIATKAGVPVSIKVGAGEETFVELSWHVQTGEAPIPILFTISPRLAQQKMKYLAYVSQSAILSSSVERSDPRGESSLELKKREQSSSH